MADFRFRLSKTIRDKKEIDAIHKHDIKDLLQSLNLLEDFNAQKIRCQFCRDIIQENNFGAIYPDDKKILFSCSKLECLAKLPLK
jgi:hypothetical protein